MKKSIRFKIVFIALVVFLAYTIMLNLVSGSISLSYKDIIDVILGNRIFTELEYNILFKIRIPRIISAILFGIALSISGFLLQTFFKNPIVGPFVLGISSGARLFVGLFILSNISIGFIESPLITIFLAAAVGSLLSMLLVLLFARKVDNISILVVVGMMIGYIASAGTDFMIAFANEHEIAALVSWSMGSFSGIGWNVLRLSAVIIIPTVVLVFFLSKPLEAYLLGENYAKSMGIDIKSFRLVLIILSSILSACVTAFAGPISFVGIAVPHIARLSIKTSNPKILVPVLVLLGASFCLLADYFARTLFSPTELSISTVTSVMGAPIVIWLMVSRRKKV